jgi:hypothetical protein
MENSYLQLSKFSSIIFDLSKRKSLGICGKIAKQVQSNREGNKAGIIYQKRYNPPKQAQSTREGIP